MAKKKGASETKIKSIYVDLKEDLKSANVSLSKAIKKLSGLKRKKG